MNLIEMTRALGAALQDDETYQNFVAASKVAEADEAVNAKMQTLQALQAAYQAEMAKEEPDQAGMEKMDQEFQGLYQEIMAAESMAALNDARNQLNGLMSYMTQILYLCANGEDPATCEPSQEECGGNCGSCGGGCGGNCGCNE